MLDPYFYTYRLVSVPICHLLALFGQLLWPLSQWPPYFVIIIIFLSFFFYNPISSLPFNLNQMPPVLIFRHSFFISFFLYDFQVRLLSIFRQFSMIYGPIFNDYWPLQLDLLDAFWLISSKVPGLILNQIWSLQSNEYFCRSHQLLMFFLSIFSLIFSIAYHFCSMLSINFCSVLVSF